MYLGLSTLVLYAIVDSPNLGFPYFDFLSGEIFNEQEGSYGEDDADMKEGNAFGEIPNSVILK